MSIALSRKSFVTLCLRTYLLTFALLPVSGLSDFTYYGFGMNLMSNTMSAAIGVPLLYPNDIILMMKVF